MQAYLICLGSFLKLLMNRRMYIRLPFILRPACGRCGTCTDISADRLCRSRTDDGTDDLCRAGVMDLTDFLNHGFVEARTHGTRGEACARDATYDAAYDAADGRMDKDFCSFAVVRKFMREFKRFLTEYACQFLLFFNFLLVKDSPELGQRIARVSAETGPVLIPVFAHVNTARCRTETGK